MGKRYIPVWHRTNGVLEYPKFDEVYVVEVSDCFNEREAIRIAEQKVIEEQQYRLDKKLML